MKAVAKKNQREPLIIHRSVDRQGATYALERRSKDRLREMFGPALHLAPRLFIAHETEADFAEIRGQIQPQIAAILTGLAEDRLSEVAPILFVDPVTEKELVSWSPGHP